MDETTPKALIATAMLARSVEQIAQLAEWTGRAGEAATWRTHHDRVRSAFASAFVRADGTVGNGSHCSYILALRLNLVPQALRAKAASLLATDIRRRGTLLTTGFLGTPLALDALVDVGETQLAFDLLLRTEFPSWGYMARKGATTIWERWNGDTGDVAMNSFNHYALGAVCGFLYRRLGGIEPVEPGFARFRVNPVFDPRIPQASTKLASVRGMIETRWAYQSNAATLELTVPANSSADVILPDGARTVGPGHHRFSI
jgi:alpha-L-rhamnosidase